MFTKVTNPRVRAHPLKSLHHPLSHAAFPPFPIGSRFGSIVLVLK